MKIRDDLYKEAMIPFDDPTKYVVVQQIRQGKSIVVGVWGEYIQIHMVSTNKYTYIYIRQMHSSCIVLEYCWKGV